MSRSKLVALAASVSAVMMVSSSAAQAAISFAPAAEYPSGQYGGPGPEDITSAVGDVNGDGKPDVVTANYYQGPGVTIQLNKGNGTFQSPGTTITVAPGVGNVLTGDFNGDGKTDIAAFSDAGVYILLGNGDGTFRKGPSYALTQAPFQDTAAVADFNRDGKLDLAVKTPNGIQMLLGNGDGSFRFGPLSSVPGSVYGGIDSIVAANMNNDGIPDLYATDGGAQKVFALKGNGDGSFTETGSGTTSNVPGTALAADLAHRGIDDAIALDEFNPPGTSAEVLLNNGSGGFQPAKAYDGGFNPANGAVGDFNGDGNPDIVSSDTTGSQLVVLPGDGHGGLDAPAKFPVATFQQSPVVADFNGDGKQDLAVAGVCPNSPIAATCLSVLLNNG